MTSGRGCAYKFVDESRILRRWCGGRPACVGPDRNRDVPMAECMRVNTFSRKHQIEKRYFTVNAQHLKLDTSEKDGSYR